MKVVKVTNPKTNTKIELRWDNLDKIGSEVTIYQAGIYAGVYSLAVADAGVTKMQAAGWPVEVQS